MYFLVSLSYMYSKLEELRPISAAHVKMYTFEP